MQPFETYEQVATFLLNEFASQFGLTTVQGKQRTAGKVTTWEIDAKGVKTGNEGFVVVECRRYASSKLDQEAVAGLAYRLHDLGADGGIIVTPVGIQEGGRRVALAEGIVTVRLDPTSTTTDYVIEFLNRVMIGRSLTLSAAAGILFEAEVLRQCGSCGDRFHAEKLEQLCPACAGKSTRETNGG
jgi:Zn finger protein HypA/HybF involved in hydrogenase expression